MSLRRLTLAALVLLALVPSVLASGLVPPEDAERVTVGDRTLLHWASLDGADAVAPGRNATLASGDDARLFFAITKGDLSALNVTAYVNVTAPDLGQPNASLVIPLPREEVPLSDTYRATTLDFAVPENATGNLSYAFQVEVRGVDANGTLVDLGSATGAGAIAIASVVAPPPPPGLPVLWLGAGLLVLGALVVGGLAYRRSAERRRMNAAPRRSQVMREMELERKLERAEEKDPEQAVAIKQEIRQQEQVREKRRELQILEAKRADAQKTLDLLRKRHEAGGLTKLQYDNMVAKKQADLAKIEAEIAQMEAEDAAGGSAAA